MIEVNWQKKSLTSIYSFEIKGIARIVKNTNCKELIIRKLQTYNIIIEHKYVWFSHSAEEHEYS